MGENGNGRSGTSRRAFLGGAAGATGVALALAAWKPETALAASATRAFSGDAVGATGLIDVRLQGDHAVLEFDISEQQVTAGPVFGAEGGHAVGDVINVKLGSDQIVHKHIGNVKYEDITINTGTGMSKGFYEWVKSTFDMKHVRATGEIVALDVNLKTANAGAFLNALITEVGFPALDASSKDAAKMTVKFQPELTRYRKAGGKTGGVKPGPPQKRWLVSNFRLDIAGLDCTRVNRIDALILKQNVTLDLTGEQRDFFVNPGSVDVPNLVVRLPLSHAQTWSDWFQDFVVQGKSAAKTGSLSFLDQTLKELFRLDLGGVGIFKLEDDPDDAPDAVRRVKAEMFVETMAFSYTSAATGG